jgi:myo-inositol-1(or 4)-monophosphatase
LTPLSSLWYDFLCHPNELGLVSKELDIAATTAEQAGAILIKHFGKTLNIRYKDRINLVTKADREAEQNIVRRLLKAFPAYGILAEEGTAVAGDTRWIVDPLDGTTNYAHGYPIFCVSIALERDGEIVLGVIYDPVRKEMFSAERGHGAVLNRNRIHVSRIRSLGRAFLVTGFSYDVHTSPDNNLDHFTNFILKAQAVRRDGSAALDLVYLACGRFDGFWELKLHSWDTAAGSLLVQEAGGRVTDFRGRPFSIYAQETLASNGFIHKVMQRVLAKALPKG